MKDEVAKFWGHKILGSPIRSPGPIELEQRRQITTVAFAEQKFDVPVPVRARQRIEPPVSGAERNNPGPPRCRPTSQLDALWAWRGRSFGQARLDQASAVMLDGSGHRHSSQVFESAIGGTSSINTW